MAGLALALGSSGGGARGLTFYHHLVTVNLTGNGSGRWQSTDGSGTPDTIVDCSLTLGIQSPATCQGDYITTSPDPIYIYWSITPAANSEGCQNGNSCSTAAQTGSMQISGDVTVGASFALQFEELSVTLTGTGSGSVTSTTGGIACPVACSDAYDWGAMVQLVAAAAAGSHFAGWSGACAGQTSTTCTVTLTTPASVGAAFATNATPTAKPTPPAATASPAPTAAATRPPASPAGSPGSIASAEPSSGAASGSPPSAGAAATPLESATSGASGSVPPGAAPGSGDAMPVVAAIVVAGALIALGLAIGGVALARARATRS